MKKYTLILMSAIAFICTGTASATAFDEYSDSVTAINLASADKVTIVPGVIQAIYDSKTNYNASISDPSGTLATKIRASALFVNGFITTDNVHYYNLRKSLGITCMSNQSVLTWFGSTNTTTYSEPVADNCGLWNAAKAVSN